MIAIVHVPGRSGSGKTTLITALVSEFHRRGYRAGVLKHCGHGFDAGPAGKDGDLFAGAGARAVALAAEGRVSLTLEGQDPRDVEGLVHFRLPADLDLVFVEGYKDLTRFPRLLTDPATPGVHRLVMPGDPRPDDLAAPGDPVRREAWGASAVADLLEREVVRPARARADLALRVNGREVPLKGFVQDLLANVVRGLVNSLKFCDAPRTVELVLSEGETLPPRAGEPAGAGEGKP
ncbi:MAG: molybdopterin-guanine dinucleotide biosynthesis protein MobB [Acidobacteria bacterium]|nr:molybdopterin-guanine dinucleotide biosynthesis protein MobB [Acidobacteriota bacterium]